MATKVPLGINSSYMDGTIEGSHHPKTRVECASHGSGRPGLPSMPHSDLLGRADRRRGPSGARAGRRTQWSAAVLRLQKDC